MRTLLTGREVDELLRYPRGRSLKMARAGDLPHVVLPDGEIRFDEQEIERVLLAGQIPAQQRAELVHA